MIVEVPFDFEKNTNLKNETLKELKEHNKKPTDVVFVGFSYKDKLYKVSFEEFLIAADFKYDSSFGGIEINPTLMIVGNDFWLERHEYDGSEWFEFKTLPNIKDYKQLHTELTQDMLKEIFYFDQGENV